MSNPSDIGRIISELKKNEDFQPQRVEGSPLDPRLALLREWQSNRLKRTYVDLLEDKRFAPACGFFLSDIYASRDFSQRDHDFERLYAGLSRLFPAYMLQLLANAIHLNRMTYELDERLLKALVENLGMVDSISPEMYAAGYRICDNYAERAEQIKLLAEILREVSQGAQLPLVGLTLRLARKPAQSMGWFELYDFLDRGYAAYKPMRGSHEFADTIEKREMKILDGIFSGDPDPFSA